MHSPRLVSYIFLMEVFYEYNQNWWPGCSLVIFFPIQSWSRILVLHGLSPFSIGFHSTALSWFSDMASLISLSFRVLFFLSTFKYWRFPRFCSQASSHFLNLSWIIQYTRDWIQYTYMLTFSICIAIPTLRFRTLMVQLLHDISTWIASLHCQLKLRICKNELLVLLLSLSGIAIHLSPMSVSWCYPWIRHLPSPYPSVCIIPPMLSNHLFFHGFLSIF